jgi:glycosyltransferase 2 family protein
MRDTGQDGREMRSSAWLRAGQRWLPGVVVSAAAIILLLAVVDPRQLVAAWQRAKLVYFLPGILLLLVAMAARGLAWRVLAGRNIPPLRAFWVLNVGYLVNAILPLRLGDLARAVLAGSPRAGEPAQLTGSAALSSVILERVLDLAFTFGLVMLALPVVGGQSWGSRAVLWTTLAAVIGLAGVLVAGMLRIPLTRALGAGASPTSIRVRWTRRLDHFLLGLQALRDWRVVLPALLLLGATWLAWLLEYTVLLRAYLPRVSLGQGLVALVGSALGMMIPSSPGGIGVYEAAVAGALTIVGVERETALAYAVSVHVLNSAGVIVLGMIGLVREGQTLERLMGKVWRLSSGRTTENPPA